MVKYINAEQAASIIEDGSIVALTGFGGIGQCEEILKGIRKSFLEDKHPNNLTIFHPSGQSDGRIGIEHLALEGLVKRVIGAHWGLAPKMSQLIQKNQVEAYSLPQGQLTHLFRTIANKLPGHLSPIGLNTFVDPRLDGAKVNEITQDKEDIIDLIHIDQKEYLFYKSVSFDYIIIRGTTIDEEGNLSTEEEPLKLEILTAAQAAKACGGKVIVQAKYLAEKGSLHPKAITIPGFLVDYAVLVEDAATNHRQTPDHVFNPAYNGDLAEPEGKQSKTPLSVRKIIGERAYQELSDNNVINLGIGLPGDEIGPIVEANKGDKNIIVTVESGPIGGVPAGKNSFGVSKNPQVILSQASQFDFYHGTGVDVTYMGAGEVDQFGNVNVSKFSNKVIGSGGFIDITQAAKKVVFCSTFTAGGYDIEVQDGPSIKVEKNGSVKKFVEHVDMVTFSGAYALEKGIEVLYVTERGVFKLTPDGLELIEITAGVDLQKDILDQMDFEPIISKKIRPLSV